MPLSEPMSVGWYQPRAHAAIDEILAGGGRPLVVGGTGLYLRAALSQLPLPSPPVAGERGRWEGTYSRLGPEGAHALLAERDPAAAARVHPNDRKRVVRALELAAAGESLAPERDDLWSRRFRLPTLLVALELPLDELDRRIDARTAQLAAHGAAAEAPAGVGRPTVSDRGARCSGSRRSRPCPRRKRSRWWRRRPGGSPATSASGSGGFPASLGSTPADPPRRSPMRSVALAGAGERLPRH